MDWGWDAGGGYAGGDPLAGDNMNSNSNDDDKQLLRLTIVNITITICYGTYTRN